MSWSLSVVRVITPVDSLNWARIVSLSAVKVSVSLTIVCPPTTLVEAAPNVAPANEESESRSSPGMNEPIETVALLIAFTSESAKPVSSGTGASFSVNVTNAPAERIGPVIAAVTVLVPVAVLPAPAGDVLPNPTVPFAFIL